MKGFDFDVTKAEQIFDLLLKEKQLKLPENHKLPTAQELQGRLYCKWHHSFTHTTGECKELRRQIQLAIEQGRLILAQHTMKVVLLFETHRRAATGNTKSREVAGALAGTASSSTARNPVTRPEIPKNVGRAT